MWIASLGKRSNVTLSTNAAAAAVVFMSKGTLAKAFVSALMAGICLRLLALVGRRGRRRQACGRFCERLVMADAERLDPALLPERQRDEKAELDQLRDAEVLVQFCPQRVVGDIGVPDDRTRSEEHTSELQSHSFISYAVFCLKKKKNTTT